MYRLFGSLQIQIIVVCAASLLLLIPNPYSRSLIILGFGALLYAWEKRLKMLVPASPGVMFWLGNVLSYIVGGVGMATLQNAWGDFGLRYLNDALLYLGLGFSSYLLGAWIAGKSIIPKTPRTLFREFKFQDWKLSAFCILFIAPVILSSEARSGGTLYYNLITGAIQSIESVPLILLAIYLYAGRTKWWLVASLLGAAFVVPIEGMMIGYGRSKLIFAVLALALLWLALHQWDGIRLAKRSKLIIVFLPVFVISYFGVMSAYRNSVRFDRNMSTEARGQIFRESILSTSSDGFVIESLTTFTARLAQAEGLELLGSAQSGSIEKYGWTEADLKNVLFSYVPQVFFPEKNEGLGRDIMEYYGFTIWNNIPPTLLADSFRRSGVLGVIIVYLLMGMLATWMAIFLNDRWGSIGPFLALFLGISSMALVSADAVTLLQFYIYRMVTSGAVTVALLYVTGITSR
ncbi:MAG: hypothetical protein IPN92_04095 [Chromatiaceae bacterium]|nr:hypothetical protein [Chromatiaceae bacterium]